MRDLDLPFRQQLVRELSTFYHIGTRARQNVCLSRCALLRQDSFSFTKGMQIGVLRRGMHWSFWIEIDKLYANPSFGVGLHLQTSYVMEDPVTRWVNIRALLSFPLRCFGPKPKKILHGCESRQVQY